ncbi:MAG TPA: nicotinate-nucleotide adenylyltransferase [Rhodanobacteraceae bacterium]|nr:nicotinate-nucleotide adenylyltransferase [Rhodanobacteraceae bacterium]
MIQSAPVAVLGGTFDPVHNGHLRVAWEAADLLHAEVRLLPANVPPHRPPPAASAAARVALLRAALAGQNRLQLDCRELERDGPSFTVDTLAELRRELGPQRALVLLVGADAFAGLASWHRWRELFELAHIAVLTRPGHAPSLTAELGAEYAARRADSVAAIRGLAAGRVLPLAVTPLEISASAIRLLLAAGHQPRYLVPDALLADPVLLAPYRHDTR